jgi:hypothetical protein
MVAREFTGLVPNKAKNVLSGSLNQAQAAAKPVVGGRHISPGHVRGNMMTGLMKVVDFSVMTTISQVHHRIVTAKTHRVTMNVILIHARLFLGIQRAGHLAHVDAALVPRLGMSFASHQALGLCKIVPALETSPTRQQTAILLRVKIYYYL